MTAAGPSAVPAAGASAAGASPRVPYDYAVVRLVPDLERGESVNVGVLLYCQAHDLLLCAVRCDPARWLALSPGLDVDVVTAALHAYTVACAADDEPARVRFGRLTAPRSTIVHAGPVHAGLTHDPEAALARLRARLLD